MARNYPKPRSSGAKTYSELRRFHTFHERYLYLKLNGVVGSETFGFDRYLNQDFYKSFEWKRVRDVVITRDLGCDLGVEGHEINDRLYVHHMNPMGPEDIKHSNIDILDPEYLICVTHDTHNAIHFGDERLLRRTEFVVRRPGDTKLW
jgi:hypothetical protein